MKRSFKIEELLGLSTAELEVRLKNAPEFTDCEKKVQGLMELLPYHELILLLENCPDIEKRDDEPMEDDDCNPHAEICRACGEELTDEGDCPNDCTESDDYGVLIGIDGDCDRSDWDD